MKGYLLIPSFIGLVGWLFGVSLLLIYRENFDEISLVGWWVIGYVGSVLALVSFLCRDWFGGNVVAVGERVPRLLLTFLLLVAISFAGTVLQLIALGSGFGGLRELVYLYFNAPLEVRGSSLAVESAGTQLTYFGWPAVFVGVCAFRRSRQAWVKWLVAFAIIVTFASNLLFVDRTRPLWILFMTLFASVAAFDELRVRALQFFLASGVVALSFFFGFSLFTGKVAAGGLGLTFAIYGASSFVYLDKVVTSHVEGFTLVRSFYPVSKFLEALGVVDHVPSPVLEPKFVPYWTNVATMVEPLYSDGGWALLTLGFPLLCFAINALARIAMRSGTSLGYALYGSLMFSMLIGFFVPKFVSTPNYVFFGLALFASIGGVSRFRASR